MLSERPRRPRSLRRSFLHSLFRSLDEWTRASFLFFCSPRPNGACRAFKLFLLFASVGSPPAHLTKATSLELGRCCAHPVSRAFLRTLLRQRCRSQTEPGRGCASVVQRARRPRRPSRACHATALARLAASVGRPMATFLRARSLILGQCCTLAFPHRLSWTSDSLYATTRACRRRP